MGNVPTDREVETHLEENQGGTLTTHKQVGVRGVTEREARVVNLEGRRVAVLGIQRIHPGAIQSGIFFSLFVC